MEKDQKQNYWIVIPTKLFFNGKGNKNSKGLYGLISSLAEKEGYCYASNNYLAEIIKTSSRTIRRWLNELKEMNYLRCEYDETLKNSSKRKIYINGEWVGTKNVPTRMDKIAVKCPDGGGQNSSKMSTYNNIDSKYITEQSSVTHKKTNSSLKRNKKVTSNKKPKQGVQQHTQTSGTPAGDIDVAWNTHAKLYQYINELDADGQKIDTLGAKKFKILAYYAILAKQKILNKVQWESFVNRNIKVVSRLIEQEWSCKQICLTSFLLEAKNLSWSLESIEKWIPRLDSELAKQTSEEEGKYAELFRELKDNIIKLNNQFKK